MDLLDGPVREYEWGSPTAIPELLGRAATGAPVAELWLGAHPSAPALVGGRSRPLDEEIAADPVATLGAPVAERFGSLPFLLKVLAAGEPLSLQAHPSAEQAAAGFAREEAEGIPLEAPHRCFRDPFHKPELICALSEFDALCGFRDPAASLEVLATIDTDALDPVRQVLREAPDAAGLRLLLEQLLGADRDRAAALTGAVVDACRGEGPEEAAAVRATAAALGSRYPGDPGVVIALLLNHLTLQPGEALFLGPGNLHAYLRGTGVEIMASSDNVLRGGLTSKHVDVATLLDIVEADPIVPEVQRPAVVDGVARYEAPVPEFSLDRIEVAGEHVVDPGPAILLCTRGSVEAGNLVLERGSAAWIPASDGAVAVAGRGTVFRAGVGAVDVS